MKAAYPVLLTPSASGFVVYVPDLDINTEGRDLADALSMAADAIGLAGLALQELGQPVPEPSRALPACAEGEIAAYALVDFEAVRRANDRRTVRKNVTLPAYLNDAAERAGINFSRLLQEAITERLNA